MREEDLQTKGTLTDVPESQFFILHDGRVIKNLPELKAAMEQMSEETFRYHVSGENNDFANWVREVIGDQELAADLARIPDRVELATRIAKRTSRLLSASISNWSPIFRPPVQPF
jgi:hypothetical protein